MLIRKNVVTQLAIAGIGLSASVFTSLALAASPGTNNDDLQKRYESDVALCNSNQSYQDKSTCLKEAGAALAEARKHRLTQNEQLSVDNKTKRCNALPADQRDDCLMQMSGTNTTSIGSVEGGGVLRETTITLPAN